MKGLPCEDRLNRQGLFRLEKEMIEGGNDGCYFMDGCYISKYEMVQKK